MDSVRTQVETVTEQPQPTRAAAIDGPPSSAAAIVMPRAQWREAQEQHRSWADAASRAHRHRRQAGIKHPVEDFLWEYYPFSPGQLRRWSPGALAVLVDGQPEDTMPLGFAPAADGYTFDAATLPSSKREHLRTTSAWILNLQQRTLQRKAGFGCFGLHEWAMVLDQSPEEIRHEQWQLRVDQRIIGSTIEQLGLRCTHFDAWRFFTPRATSMNPEALSRRTQPDTDQPGCLHANMDLYKWAMRLQPLVSSGLVRDTFDLARRIRTVDMQAAPYEFTALGIVPIDVTTTQGRAEFVRLQQGFSDEAHTLRVRLIAEIEPIAGLL